MKAQYIIFEGIDGCGKTTQSKMLVDRLNAAGHKAVWSREPGSPLIQLKVRDLLLSHEPLSRPALELLFQADRAEHAVKIKQLLAENTWVVSDRSFVSGLSYGVACGNDGIALANLVEFAIGDLRPNRVFMLDILPEEAVKRRGDRGDQSGTREEVKGEEFAGKVRNNMLAILQSAPPNKVTVLNGTDTIENIASSIDKILDLNS